MGALTHNAISPKTMKSKTRIKRTHTTFEVRYLIWGVCAITA